MADRLLESCDAPVVVILGCTGTGKSKLAIEIAKEVGGEIISADSMQVYKGLDIITNKVTPEEQAIVPHHMIDVVEATEKFSVVQFKNMALRLIYDIFKRGKMPIIVGGTNYYIESLLWKNLIETEVSESCVKRSSEIEVEQHVGDDSVEEITNQDDTERNKSEHGNPLHRNSEPKTSNRANTKDENTEHENSEYKNTEHENSKHGCSGPENSEYENTEHENAGIEIDKQAWKADPSEQQLTQDPLYQKLLQVDAAMARKVHPNDTRKIARSLQVYEHCGITHSELIAQQQAQEGATVYGGPMRFRNVCVLWLQCELETLDKRLDSRVDKMIESGLVVELLEFHNSWKSGLSDQKISKTEGIFQSIGFKEFHDFLNSEKPLTDKNSEVFSRCVDSMKCATRRYARKQIKWVVNRFLGRPPTCGPDVYALEATDLEQWESRVLEMGLKIVKASMEGERLVEMALSRVESNAASKHSRHICEVCNNRTIIGDKNWHMHLQSRSHKHYKKKAKKLETNT